MYYAYDYMKTMTTILVKNIYFLRWALYFFGATILVVACYFVLNKSAPASVPSQAKLVAPVLSYELLKTVDLLQSSFTTPENQSVATQTKEYTVYMTSLKKSCDSLRMFYAESKKNSPGSDTTIYLAKSDSLCRELSQLAADSQKIFDANSPILSIDTRLKRNQTIPVISDSLKNSRMKKINSALEQIERVSNDIEYPTTTLDGLKELKKTISSSTSSSST